MRKVRQMSRTGIVRSPRIFLAAITIGWSPGIGGRPPFLPRARATANSAFVLYRISRSSNWASATKRWKTSASDAVVV